MKITKKRRKELTPRKTTINAEPATWTEGIFEEWLRHANNRIPPITNEVTHANYYTPRPYVDEWNRGSRERGFVYTEGGRVYDVRLIGEKEKTPVNR